MIPLLSRFTYEAARDLMCSPEIWPITRHFITKTERRLEEFNCHKVLSLGRIPKRKSTTQSIRYFIRSSLPYEWQYSMPFAETFDIHADAKVSCMKSRMQSQPMTWEFLSEQAQYWGRAFSVCFPFLYHS